MEKIMFWEAAVVAGQDFAQCLSHSAGQIRDQVTSFWRIQAGCGDELGPDWERDLLADAEDIVRLAADLAQDIENAAAVINRDMETLHSQINAGLGP